MKRLIINADDFGLHESVNLGIIEGHIKGCITSTSIMAGGSAFEHALVLTAAAPELRFGVHLTLVGERPVAPAGDVPSLVDTDGRLCRDYPAFLKKICSGRVRLDEVRRELAAQVGKVLAAGVQVTHLDSHQHMHVVPGIIDIVIDIAREYNIRAIRIPDEPLSFFCGYNASAGRIIGRSGLTILAWLARKKARQAGLMTPDHFFGMLAGGNMQERYLLAIIDSLPDGVTEIMLHPGLNDQELNVRYDWNYHWQTELAAVSSGPIRARLAAENVKLVSFASLI